MVETFGRRFGVEVIDAFGATEGGLALNRDGPDRAGSLGQAGEQVQVVDPEGQRASPRPLRRAGRLLNADECVGEIVNTAGVGPFEGYYNNPEANETTTRFGWYWSETSGTSTRTVTCTSPGATPTGSASTGRTSPPGPSRWRGPATQTWWWPSGYGVPDEQAGDQVMATVLLREGSAFDGSAFGSWVDRQEDLGPKWRPRYLRLARELPTTGTNKVLKRMLVRQKFRSDQVGDDELWVRLRGEDAYHLFSAEDEALT